MSDFVSRAKALNADIKKVNRASDESRTRLKVRKEQFITMLEEFGKAEGIDLVTPYTEGGLEGIAEVLNDLKAQASEKLERDVAVSQQIIEAYGRKDFAEIDKLLGRPKVAAKAPVKAAAKVEVQEEEVEEPEGFKTESIMDQISNAAKESATVSFSADELDGIGVETDVEETSVSVFDAVADIDGDEEAVEAPVQSTQPSLASFGFGTKSEAPVVEKKAPAKTSLFALTDDDDDEEFAKPPVSEKKAAKKNPFVDDDDEGGAEFGDVSLAQILGSNVNVGGSGF